MRPLLLNQVCLRSPEERDRAAYLHVVRDSQSFHAPWTQLKQDDAGFDAMLEQDRDVTTSTKLVLRVQDDALVGYFRLSQIFYGALCSAYLGYWGAREHARHGYMTAGLHHMLRHAFEALKLHRVEANVQPGNHDSIALVRRCGFRKEGFSPRYLNIGDVWCDHERWALTFEDWSTSACDV